MASNSFKIKNSLVLTPKDLSTLVSPEAGDLACDINDNNKIKRYDANAAAWVEVGSGGVGGVDIFFVQDFESASLSSFTQTGLVLSQTDPLKGKVSAVLNHQAGTSPANDQSFKQIISVDRKFRGQTMVMRLDSKSDASQGNLVIKIYDETNSANIVASEQLQLSNEVSGKKTSVSFTIPETCASLSYTITALPESGKVSRIDDIICELAETALLETAVEVPVVTAWQGYTPTFQGFGSPSAIEFEWRQVGENVEIRGKFVSGASTAVEARVGLPAGLTSAGTGVIPSIQVAGGITAYSAVGAVLRFPLVEPSVTYLTFGAQESGAAGLTKVNGTGFVSTGNTVSFHASVPCAGLSATTTKTIPLTQSGLVQGADSVLYAAGNAGQSITASVTNIPYIFSSSTGSDITWSGDSFTVQTDGLYNINGSFRTTAAISNQSANLYKNGTLVKALGFESSSIITPFSSSEYLTAGSTYSIRAGGNATLTNDNNFHWIQITKQGSLKQVSVNPNSKITIPTSELRFEGASSRGSTATAIVKFDTMAKLRGDAFTVESDSVLGTRITMKKAGKLDVSATLSANATPAAMYISKNQATLTTAPSGSEVLAVELPTASSFATIASSVFVAIGDIIRVSMSNNPTSSIANQLNLSFQEQDISVSVTNTLPQFSDSDLTVKAYGNSGQTLTASVTDIPFSTTTEDSTGGAWNGTQFTVPEDGTYNISGCVWFSVGTTSRSLALFVNGTRYKQLSPYMQTTSMSYAGTDKFTKGQVLSLRSLIGGGVIHNDPGVESYHYINITKVGKPNVTGVDVTPFVNVPQPESQSLSITSNLSVNGANLTGALTSSTGNSLLSYNSSTGVYTVLKRCTINANYTARTAGAAEAQIEIAVDSTSAATQNSKAEASDYVNCSYNGILNAGQTIVFRAAINAVNIHYANIVATALSDQILTAPETFSTDTAALVYAPSSTYTLSTLANAPVGTYITFTYAANTNTRTQTTTRPTQTDADMNANGILLYTRAYNAASTSGNPSAIAIQIGKGLKGKSLELFKSAGKLTAGSLEVLLNGSTFYGPWVNSYDELSGVLYFDVGFRPSAATSSTFIFEDLATQSSGYLVINASKNPALTGFGLNRVAARAINTAGTSIATTGTIIPWDANKTFDTHNALNAATGVFTAPEAGYYKVDASFLLISDTYSINQKVYCHIVKNGVDISGGLTSVMTTSAVQVPAIVSDIVYLVKGDTLSIKAYADSGPTALIANSTYNFLSIAKVSV